MRTSVISDVNHDVRDPGCFELFDRTNGIPYEQLVVCHEGADKQLATKRKCQVETQRQQEHAQHLSYFRVRCMT